MSRALGRAAAYVLVASALAVAASACSKEAAPASRSPADTAAPASESAADSAASEPRGTDDLQELEAELDRLQGELADAGVGGEGVPEPATDREATARCDRICALASTTCDLGERVCALASTHEGDDRYARACDRATSQCETAQAACTRCR